jgi:septin family protein
MHCLLKTGAINSMSNHGNEQLGTRVTTFINTLCYTNLHAHEQQLHVKALPANIFLQIVIRAP